MSAGNVMGRLNQKNVRREAYLAQSATAQTPRKILRGTAGIIITALLAGCSSDVSRLAHGPFGAVDHTPTASIGSQQSLVPPQSVSAGGSSAGSNGYGYAPSSPVRSAPLAPVSAVQSAPLAPPQNSWQPSAASASAPALPSRPTFTSVPANVGPWSTVGGSPVTVGPGETVAALSSRYGVPPDTLLKVNGLTSASQVTSGSRLVIPVYNASAPAQAAAVKAVAAPAAATKAVAATTAPAQSVATKAAAAQTTVKAAAPVAVDPKIALREKAAAEKAALAAKKIEDAKIAKAKVAEDASAAAKRTKVVAVDAEETTASVPAESKPEFRWPARGRIIQGFRSGANDGINIALPEGTSVKAAESGVVAYAGSELKGYGNLVLIRHPNGYVSAYAHNGAVAVKRGETVKRGQTIAKSGQSGNVASPQLHFELRKGSTPVDPTGYLAGL
jgi:murein DD-endopeptidase MepM/ murein hydrolase activator NlpD